MLIVVDWTMLVICLMGFFNFFFHGFDGLRSRCRRRCRSWDRSGDYSYGNWLLYFLYWFKFDGCCYFSFIDGWWAWIGLLRGLFSRLLVLLALLVIWVKLLFPVVLVLHPVMIKVVRVFIL